MVSEGTDWTLKFRNVNGVNAPPFEVRPVSLNLTMNRVKYDFCRAKLPWEVGERMKPNTKYEDGRLRGLYQVDVCHDGDVIQPMLFRPDWVEYGDQFTHLQLHDLHKALASGVVDEQRESVKLKDIYQTIIDSAGNSIIDEVRFTLPENQVRTIHGSASRKYLRQQRNQMDHRTERERETEQMVDSRFAVDFDQITPEEAITRLNKKFRIRSWVNREGVLVIGFPEANSIRHVAAPDDRRVWRWKDPNITHPREPVKAVIVKGSWADEPGLEVNPFEWFDKGGTADVRAIGIAKRTDVANGTVFTVDAKGAKRDSLEDIASIVLREEVQKQNTGTVEIDPALSGSKVSLPIDASPGDVLRLVPDDDLFDNPTKESGQIGDEPENWNRSMGAYVNNEDYLISQVEHNVSDMGRWTFNTNLGLVPDDIPIETTFTYFDPRDDKYVDPDKIGKDGDLKGSWLSFEDI